MARNKRARSRGENREANDNGSISHSDETETRFSRVIRYAASISFAAGLRVARVPGSDSRAHYLLSLSLSLASTHARDYTIIIRLNSDELWQPSTRCVVIPLRGKRRAVHQPAASVFNG